MNWRLPFSSSLNSVIGEPGSLGRHWFLGVSATSILRGVAYLLTFGSGVLVARLLGPAGLGVFAYALAVMGFATVIAALGLPAAVTRFLTIYRETGQWSYARGLVRFSNAVTGIVGVALGVLAAFAVSGLRQTQYQVTTWLAVPLVPLASWAMLRQNTLQAWHHPVAAQLPEQLVKHLVFLSLGGSLWLSGMVFIRDPAGLMLCWLVAMVSTVLSGVIFVHRAAGQDLHRAPPVYAPRRWIKVALPMLVSDGAGILFGSIDIIILGWFRSPITVGLYQVALRCAAIILIFVTGSNIVLAPWFAKLHAHADRLRLQAVVTRATRAVFAASAVVFLLLVFFGRTFLGFVFGSAFKQAFGALVILGAARVITCGIGPVVNLLAMTGGQKALAWTVSGAALANLAGCLLFIPSMGMMGAAWSTSVVLVVYQLTLRMVVRHHTGIDSTIWGHARQPGKAQ